MSVTHSFSLVEVSHTYVATVMAAKIKQVNGGTHPEIKTWQPHQDSVLEALCEVWVSSVPCMVPILLETRRKKRIKQTKITSHLY